MVASSATPMQTLLNLHSVRASCCPMISRTFYPAPHRSSQTYCCLDMCESFVSTFNCTFESMHACVSAWVCTWAHSAVEASKRASDPPELTL